MRTPVNDYKIPCIPKDTHSLGAIQNLKLDNDEDYSKLSSIWNILIDTLMETNRQRRIDLIVDHNNQEYICMSTIYIYSSGNTQSVYMDLHMIYMCMCACVCERIGLTIPERALSFQIKFGLYILKLHI